MTIAPTLNVAAIVGSWIVFIMAHVAYSVTSRSTRQNLAQAEAFQSVFNTQINVMKSAGEAYRIETDGIVKELSSLGLFREHGITVVAHALGVNPARIKELITGESSKDGEGTPVLTSGGIGETETIIFQSEANPAPATITPRPDIQTGRVSVSGVSQVDGEPLTDAERARVQEEFRAYQNARSNSNNGSNFPLK